MRDNLKEYPIQTTTMQYIRLWWEFDIGEQNRSHQLSCQLWNDFGYICFTLILFVTILSLVSFLFSVIENVVLMVLRTDINMQIGERIHFCRCPNEVFHLYTLQCLNHRVQIISTKVKHVIDFIMPPLGPPTTHTINACIIYILKHI